MTAQDKRIAIALHAMDVADHWRHTLTNGKDSPGYESAVEIFLSQIPDYPNDLNAMHKVAMKLPLTMRTIMFGYMYKTGGCMFETAFLTAEQWADAYLMTIDGREVRP